MSDYDWNGEKLFAEMVGKTITAIEVDEDKERVKFACADGKRFLMYHSQDCCETVKVEDICGDLGDLIGSPIVLAEAVTSPDRPTDLPKEEYADESATWTFYKMATNKGSVTIRWHGSSNGYYSESVTFAEDSP